MHRVTKLALACKLLRIHNELMDALRGNAELREVDTGRYLDNLLANMTPQDHQVQRGLDRLRADLTRECTEDEVLCAIETSKA